MKIGIYNDWWYPQLVGGAERSALEVSTKLEKAFGAANLVVVTLSNDLKSSITYHNQIKIVRIGSPTLRHRYLVSKPVRIFERFRILLDFVTPYRIARTFSRTGVKVVVAHNIDRAGLKMIFFLHVLYRIPVLRVVHDLSDTCIRRTRYRNERICVSTCLPCIPKLALHRAIGFKSYKFVLCNSRFTLNKLRSLGLKKDSIGYGYLVSRTSLNFVKGSIPRLSAKEATVGFVGRISPEKGIPVLIEALASLKSDSGHTFNLILVGQGDSSLVDSIVDLARKSDVAIEVTGYIEHPFDYLRAKVDLIVVPSLWEETFGRVAYEALNHDFRLVVADIGGLPEAASLSGKPYLVFEPSNVSALASAIAQSLTGSDGVRRQSVPYRSLADELIAQITLLRS